MDRELAVVRKHLRLNQARRQNYVEDGGEDTIYLDGKIIALAEVLEELDPDHADEYRQAKLEV